MRLIICLLLTGKIFNAAAAQQLPPPESVDLSAYIMEQCDEFSQAGIRDCLKRKVTESAKALIVLEDKATAVLKQWDEEADFVGRADEKLRASRKAFISYRDAQCIFAASLGGGAIPKALEMRQMACLYSINTERLNHLKRLIADIPRR